jgi:hypothetical protein
MPGSTAPSSTDVEEQPSEALARVRRGELSLDAYLETLVERALAHVKGRVSEERLGIVREVVRDSLREAPEFQEAIRLLTGQTPQDPSGSH